MSYKYHRLRGRIGEAREEQSYIQQPYIQWEFVAVPDFHTNIYFLTIDAPRFTREDQTILVFEGSVDNNFFTAIVNMCITEDDYYLNKTHYRIEIHANKPENPEVAWLTTVVIEEIEACVEGVSIFIPDIKKDFTVFSSEPMVFEGDVSPSKDCDRNVVVITYSIPTLGVYKRYKVELSYVGETGYCTYVEVPLPFSEAYESFLHIINVSGIRYLGTIQLDINEVFTTEKDEFKINYKRDKQVNEYTEVQHYYFGNIKIPPKETDFDVHFTGEFSRDLILHEYLSIVSFTYVT